MRERVNFFWKVTAGLIYAVIPYAKYIPWSKEIIHGYVYYDDRDYDRTDWYRLEKNDKAYTLPIPRSVRNFQVSLGNIDRPARTPFVSTNVHGSSLDNLDEKDDDDYDDDYDW